MKVYLASDHAGFELKEKIKNILEQFGYEPVDCGAFSYDQNDDYPDFVGEAARKVAKDSGSMGIVLGKSGAGECIVANKINGIRAFLVINERNVVLAREHNNANIMSIGSEFVDESEMKNLIHIFLETPFSNEERHIRRIGKISEIENNE